MTIIKSTRTQIEIKMIFFWKIFVKNGAKNWKFKLEKGNFEDSELNFFDASEQDDQDNDDFCFGCLKINLSTEVNPRWAGYRPKG